MPKSLLRLLTVAAMVALPLTAAAQERDAAPLIYELRLGLLQHDIAIVAADDVEDGAALNGELAFRSLTDFWGGSLRPVLGGTFSTENRTHYGYFDLRWEALWDKVFFGIGLGGAIHDGELSRDRKNKDLGSRVLFHIPAELGYQFTPRNRISLYFEHISNADLADPNPGMDSIGLRLSHRF
ncbi:acyloxyacyl hydrolase [Desertibaculum subflavum]|uniref:acyloxyacyl hydrolase n=1 Tax=Desertibaculum subflavum TaxID=2268458 RepID=UPI000E66E968